MTSRDKEKLPTVAGTSVFSQAKGRRSTLHYLGLGLFLVSCCVAFNRSAPYLLDRFPSGVILTVPASEACRQVDPLVPDKNGEMYETLSALYHTNEFKMKAVEWLGGAVRVPTETFDDMGPVGEDPKWDSRGPFHDYLEVSYPFIHSTLELSKVNTYGLVYVWKGSNDDLKPMLLMAHQDVVPVDPTTVDQWTHPPFSGHFDGKRIWGRGSSDDKSGLIGIMSSIETLIRNGFKPIRTVILSFGFDEEVGGAEGAKPLANYLLQKYGDDAFEMIVDEGGGYSTQYGAVMAVPAVAEKGTMNVKIEVHAPGGHSSVPPDHTSIGMLSTFLTEYEAHPFPVGLGAGTPVFAMAQCLAAHAPGLPSSVQKAIEKAPHSRYAMKKVEEYLFKDKAMKALASTTQAIDLVQGGVKSNALPEQAWAIVNHRVATDSSVGATQKRDTELLDSLAHKFNLTFTAFGELVSPEGALASGTLELTASLGLEPAPVTPASGKPYKLLSGTIRATYNAQRSLQGENIFVSPGIMSGNTDTKYYWNLSKHIFRYNHGSGGLGNVHTVNEFVTIDGFLEQIRFFTTLILNVDEASLSE